MSAIFRLIRSLGFRRGPDRLLGGVCAGISASTGVCVLWVRVIMAIAVIIPIIGISTYLAVWILTPWQTGSIPLERFIDGWNGRD